MFARLLETRVFADDMQDQVIINIKVLIACKADSESENTMNCL